MTKPRFDGKGDSWARSHRSNLPGNYYMTDIDGLGLFTMNSSNEFFCEYVVGYPRDSADRKVTRGVFALFDRKASLDSAFSERNATLGVYLLIARGLAREQTVAPKFCFVIGGQDPPWRVIEVDIYTGNRTGNESYVSTDDGWMDAWIQLGIDVTRKKLLTMICGF